MKGRVPLVGTLWVMLFALFAFPEFRSRFLSGSSAPNVFATVRRDARCRARGARFAPASPAASVLVPRTARFDVSY